MQLSEAAGAPVGVAELEAMLSPLDLGDLAEFQAWANKRAVSEARDQLATFGDVLTPAERQRIIADAVESTRSGAAVTVATNTADGKRKLFWLSARHRRPDLAEEALNLLVKGGKVNELLAELDRISGFLEDERPNAGAASAAGSPSTPEPTGAPSTAG